MRVSRTDLMAFERDLERNDSRTYMDTVRVHIPPIAQPGTPINAGCSFQLSV